MKATIITLSETTRELFKKMHFPEIPDDANYAVFMEDGTATLVNELKKDGIMIPQMAVVMYNCVDDFTLEE